MKSIRCLLISGALAGALFLSGCATITRGTTEQLSIQSVPTGATVRLSNGFTGVTPATFTVPRKGDIFLTVSKEGYVPVEVTLYSKLSGRGTAGFLGNALIGGIIGGGVDVATGATLSHVPNPVNVTLVAKPAPPVVTASANPTEPMPKPAEPSKPAAEAVPAPVPPATVVAPPSAAAEVPAEKAPPGSDPAQPAPSGSPASPPAEQHPEAKPATDPKPEDITNKQP